MSSSADDRCERPGHPERLVGRVTSGLGDLSRWMRRHADAYHRATGHELVPGSLNVELHRAWSLPESPRIRLPPEQVGVGMNLVPCTLEGLPAFIARTDRNEAGTGHHPQNLIEIVAPVGLRQTLNLDDGDQVEILVSRPPP